MPGFNCLLPHDCGALTAEFCTMTGAPGLAFETWESTNLKAKITRSVSAQSAYAYRVPLDWNSGPLADGLACYARTEFFVAHEHWESVWLTLQEPEKSFLQALIQITAAFHHLQAGNPVGASSLLRRALRRLEFCPVRFAGIAVASLRAEVREWLAAIETGGRATSAAFPCIVPL